MKVKLIAALIAASAVTLAPAANSEVKVSAKGGLNITSGDYKFQFGGRIQYDYNRSEKNGEVDEDDFDLRRGRVYFKGNVTKDWHFKTNFDTDGATQDLYLQYRGWGKVATVTIGNQHQPFTLQQLISSKDVSISERSGIVERYSIGRRESLVLNGDIDNLHYAIGLFKDEGKDEDNGVAARVAYAPFNSNTGVIHIGASYKETEEQDALGIELAAVSGPLHFQGEYFDGQEVAATGENDVDGYYAQVGYVLTGETRPYKQGKLKRIKPQGKSGAWEVVARYEDGDGDFGDVELGTDNASVVSLGLNYYVNNNVRINASYMDGESNTSNDDGSELRVRFQLTF